MAWAAEACFPHFERGARPFLGRWFSLCGTLEPGRNRRWRTGMAGAGFSHSIMAMLCGSGEDTEDRAKWGRDSGHWDRHGVPSHV